MTIAQPMLFNPAAQETDALAVLLRHIEQELQVSETYAQAIARLRGLLDHASDFAPTSGRTGVTAAESGAIDVTAIAIAPPTRLAGTEGQTARPRTLTTNRQAATTTTTTATTYDGLISAPTQGVAQALAPNAAAVDVGSPGPDVSALGLSASGLSGSLLSLSDPSPAQWLTAAQTQAGAIGVWPLPQAEALAGVGSIVQPDAPSRPIDPTDLESSGEANPFDRAVDLLERLFELPSPGLPPSLRQPPESTADRPRLFGVSRSSIIPQDESWSQACLDISTSLREARLRRGWTIRQLSAQTYIPTHHIEALETGAVDRLPEPIYVRGFVRRLGEALGLDPRTLVDRLPAPPVTTFAAWDNHDREPAIRLQPWHVYAGYVAVISGGIGWVSQAARHPTVPALQPSTLDRASYAPPADRHQARDFQKTTQVGPIESFVAPPEAIDPH